ncbi:MAG: LysE family transporter [Sulfolobales archaeon]
MVISLDPLFITSVMTISATGALSPGPLSVITLALGARGGWSSGFQISLGHAIFELPYVYLLITLYGSVINFLELEIVKYSLVVVVMVFNTFFAYLLISDALNIGNERGGTSGINVKFSKIKQPILVGLLLTGLNPFFLIWWATVGMPIIDGVIRYGVISTLPVMYLSHVWLDFMWLSFLAHTSSKGVRHLSTKGYRLLLIILAMMLILFALNTFLKSFFNISLIPL